MWCLWSAVLLVTCALVAAEGGVGPAGAATTRAPPRTPPRTLDRQAAELAWRSWLQSPESGNPNAPPRRITTKSLFITPLVCPKGQRLDRNGCVQTVTVNKDEHERILLEQLNNLFTSAPSGDIVYDYGDDDPGPLQLSIPIGLDPQAAPLQAQEPSAQAQELQLNYVKVDKKDETKHDFDASIEAELELLKLQHSQIAHNDTFSSENIHVLNHNVLNNLMPPYDKPKRDSPVSNATENEQINNSTDEGQKEIVYGHVNVDPILYDTENHPSNTEAETEKPQDPPQTLNSHALAEMNTSENTNKSTVSSTNDHNEPSTKVNSSTHVLKKDGDQTKLNPEHDYADIGEAIKLISRYADVTTDEKFTKDQKKYAIKDDSILGTRTKIQHRRNKPKADFIENPSAVHLTSDLINQDIVPIHKANPKIEPYYRYPWQGQHSQTPPPDYPFRHLQDYWPGRSQVGGVYNTVHENPRRHHHTYPHFKTHVLPYTGYPGPYSGLQEVFPGQLQYPYRATSRHARPMRSHSNNQDLYSLLGLRHWFSSEGTSKR